MPKHLLHLHPPKKEQNSYRGYSEGREKKKKKRWEERGTVGEKRREKVDVRKD